MLRYWIIITFIGAALATTPSFSASRVSIVQIQAVDPTVAIEDAASEDAVAEDQGQFAIKPSEAALIAKNAYPDAKVLGVKFLPSGDYAVTLKVGGSVQRVLVNATSGEWR